MAGATSTCLAAARRWPAPLLKTKDQFVRPETLSDFLANNHEPRIVDARGEATTEAHAGVRLNVAGLAEVFPPHSSPGSFLPSFGRLKSADEVENESREIVTSSWSIAA